MNPTIFISDTIAAIATAPGVGGIAVIRVSGNDAITNVSKIFKGKNLLGQKGYTAHFGKIFIPSPLERVQGEAEKIIDEVVATLFKNPHSYTGEDVVEISCHGSVFIQQQILEALLKSGCRLAKPGEFTQRAFLNGKMDLSQAEAVADLIASQNESAHKVALQQLRGGYSSELKNLRERLIWFASLIELELDFSQEDVEFADRKQLFDLVDELQNKLSPLIQSFQLGNAMKNGIATAIVGNPNAGKSTLLNTLLKENRAIVSSIAGTTRDTIEESLNINGIIFRLIDTAGLRKSNDEIEIIGVEKSYEKIKEAQLILYVFDVKEMSEDDLKTEIEKLKIENKKLILVANKCDEGNEFRIQNSEFIIQNISAKNQTGINELRELIYKTALNDIQEYEGVIVSNARHVEQLQKAFAILYEVRQGLETDEMTDIIAFHLRHALHALAEITGEIQHDRDILGTIFGKFCIGK
ncbi:MAG: tRNA uridine-5-carboxymethylaminomethyl(34) synthesis GTPase MnmE [Bacteroidota bacterium]|jgi:tRNA modification GTPase